MSENPPVSRVIIVPRNGLANRLQAWASAAILAAQVDAPLQVLWQPEPPAPALPDELFDTNLVTRNFVTADEVTRILGSTHEALPRYLTTTDQFIALAGHDRGEQVFMADLAMLLARRDVPTPLVLIAGGQFHLDSSEDFTRQRQIFYAGIRWSPAVRERVEHAVDDRGPFVALHIRETDRSVQAPPAAAIRDALGTLRERNDCTSLFVAADSAPATERWSEEARRIGYEPWSLVDAQRDRTVLNGAIDSAADWLILGRSVGMVHPAASTFSVEAAVAAGIHDQAIALEASPGRQRVRRWRGHAASAASWPRRRLRRHHP